MNNTTTTFFKRLVNEYRNDTYTPIPSDIFRDLINEEKKFGSQEKINESKLYQDESIMDSLGLMHKICK